MEGLEVDYRKKPRKLPMRKREDKAKRMCTFTKRRCGLFKKASDLHLLTGADIAVVVFSEAGRPYFHGSTAVIDRFLAEPEEEPSTGGVEERVPEIDRTLTQEEEEEPSGCVFEEWIRGIDQTLTHDPKSVDSSGSLRRQIQEIRGTQIQEDSFVGSLLRSEPSE